MSDGFIKLHRGLIDSEIFASQIGLKIWVWLLLKASYKKRFVSLKIGKGETTVKIERGELLFGRFKAEEYLNIDGSTIYKWLKKMEEMEMISLQSSSHYTIIKVNNYNEYNDMENDESSNHSTTIQQPSSNQVATKEHIQESKESKESNIDSVSEKKLTPTQQINANIQFYNQQLTDLNGNDDNNEYKRLVNYIINNPLLKEPVKHVLKIKQQLSIQEFKALRSKYSFELIMSKLDVLINTEEYCRKKNVLYLTLNNYCMRQKNNSYDR